MGFDEHQMNMNQEAYEAYMTPALDQFQMDLLSYEAYLAGEEAKDDGGGIFGTILSIIGIGVSLIPGGQAIGGALTATGALLS